MHKFYLLLIAISIITLSACSNQERQWTSIVAIDGSKPIDAPRARDHFSAVVIDDKLYLAAGRNTENGDNPFGNTIGEVDVYDLKKKHWNTWWCTEAT